ncbi:MAG TPA: HTH domain-containing protein [Ktedonobacteraceae bacterium]|nr:HTH domain-containing protein [Ktedonobacteraceae bacterium]
MSKGSRAARPNCYKIIKLGLELGDGRKHLSRQEISLFLDVSDRTVYRYVSALREDFNAPIIREWPDATYACSLPWSMIESLKRL